ncbi:MAG: hypothetical protein ABI581_08925 [Sediminibacterium sp.]
MKKLLLLAMFAGSMQLLHAQDLKKVQTSYILNKMDDAKTEIDKVMADPKQNTKTEALYWKAKVYSALYKEPNTRSKYPGIGLTADEAMKKYIAADPAFALVKEKGAEPFFDMYSTAFGNGVKVFNEKKWEEASVAFASAVEYSDHIFQNKWSNAAIPFDTTSILYLAYAYQNSSKAPEAAKYYARLADAKVGGESYIDIYKFLANHYTITKDEASFKKYIAIGKELYPKFPWEEFEIDYMDQNLTLTQKSELYDKEDAAGGMSEVKYLQFGDIFVNAKSKEKNLDSLQIVKYTLKGGDAFKKAFAKNNQNAIAAFNVGVIYYNIFGEYDDSYAYNIRLMQALNTAFADRPVDKDPKKKAANLAAQNAKLEPYKAANLVLEKPLMENLDISLEWLEKSYVILKDKANRNNVEKGIMNKAVDFLANLYAYKRDRLKGKDPKAFDLFEAKYKEYDALHGKF